MITVSSINDHDTCQLISQDKSCVFSNLFALAITQSLMGERIPGISNGPGSNSNEGEVHFNRKQGSIAHKVHINSYIGSI